MPNKIMVASGQKGYHPALVNEREQIIQLRAPFAKRLNAQCEAAAWARVGLLWYDDTRILPYATVTHAQLQVGQQRSVRAYLGA